MKRKLHINISYKHRWKFFLKYVSSLYIAVYEKDRTLQGGFIQGIQGQFNEVMDMCSI